MNTTPIEFMAWNSRYNFIIGVDKEIAVCSGKVYDYIPIGFGNDETTLDDLIPMQLTALRSINDEPIYNHMIVKDDYGKHYVVDMFNYYLMYNLSNYYIKLEIVGNRFQSPELLKLCK